MEELTRAICSRTHIFLHQKLQIDDGDGFFSAVFIASSTLSAF